MGRGLINFFERFVSPSQNRKSIYSVFVVSFVLSFLFYAEQVRRRDGLSSPPHPHDSFDYDSIAVQIAKGNGVSLDYLDPEFQSPYLAAADSHGPGASSEYRERLADPHHGPTTFRPPGLPVVMAGIYRTLGRKFEVVRLLNCAAMAAAISIGLALAFRAAGVIAVAVGFVCATFVDSVRPYIHGDILSEPLATLAIMGVFVLQLHYIRGPTARTAVLIGIALGVAILFRTAFVLWLPVLLLAMFVPVTESLAAIPWWRRIANGALTLLLLATCVSPWAIRNSLLLDEFKPLGLHGEMNLSVAYSDRAMRDGGLWFNPLPTDPAAVAALPEIAYEREQILAERSRREARQWLSTHWPSVPRLMVARVLTEWWPTSRREIILLLLFALGIAIYPRRDEQWLIVCFVAAATFAVAATWSVGGRFTVPVRPLLYGCAGVGVARVAKEVLALLRRGRQEEVPTTPAEG